MEDYNKMYYYLFNRITDTIEQLKQVQLTAEEMFINQCSQPEDEKEAVPQTI